MPRLTDGALSLEPGLDWLRRRSAWQIGLIALLAGLIVATGQAPLSLPFLSLVGLLGAVALFTSAPNTKSAAWRGWIAGAGYFASSMFWIVEPFMVNPERHGWMAPFALILLSGGLALFWALAFGLAHRAGSTRVQRLVALVATFTLAGLLRSYVFTGFPWGLLAYIWMETPVAQALALVGPHGLAGLSILVAVLPFVKPHRALRGLAVSIVILLIAYGGGVYRLSLPEPPNPVPLRVRLIQPNAPQHLKWNSDTSQVFFDRQIELTKAPADQPPDVIIWPETAITYWLDDAAQPLAAISDAAGPATPVILGARRFEEPRRYYNSLALIGQGGVVSAIYDKHHLVPFGEYIPFGSFLSRFGLHGLAAEEGGGFSAGAGPEVLDLGPLGRVLPLICYEAIFPQDIAGANARPDWLLQLTNDAWYGEYAGPFQHYAQARARAVEQGLPLVRSANTGVSAVVDAKGREVATLSLGVEGHLDAEVPAAMAPTPYSKTGDFPLFIVCFLVLSGTFLRRTPQNTH